MQKRSPRAPISSAIYLNELIKKILMTTAINFRLSLNLFAGKKKENHFHLIKLVSKMNCNHCGIVYFSKF